MTATCRCSGRATERRRVVSALQTAYGSVRAGHDEMRDFKHALQGIN
ncbi:MAG: hypothetical protein WC729_03915 [Sphingomonas sp.]|jgi:hypothetical protein